MGFPHVSREIIRIRKLGLEKAKGLTGAITWREKDYLKGETVEVGVIILPTRGCSWAHKGGCSMCGYVYDSLDSSQETVLKNFRKAFEKLNGVRYLKIFNSGSFFDEEEISSETREEILAAVDSAGSIERLQVESRPEFITESALKHSTEFSKELEVGIGLETSSDKIREVSINKGFTFEDFKIAVERCKKYGVKIKAYLLIKPPFLSEKLAMEDAIASAEEAARLGVDRISFNPMNVQRFTLVERLFLNKEYSPPWLWSVVEILKRVSETVDVPVICKPTAAGKARGANNCRQCSDDIAKAIEMFSATQQVSYLNNLDCSCKEEWRLKLMYEEVTF